MNQNEQVFQNAPVKKAVLQMAVPTVISSLVLVVYNMADTFFVGQTHDAFQVAAVSLTNPVFVMYMAIANLLGIGGSAVISILLGQNEKDKARAASSFCCYASLAFGVVTGVLILLFMDPLLALLGATENTYQFSKDYLFYIALGAPFILFANTFGHTVRGDRDRAGQRVRLCVLPLLLCAQKPAAVHPSGGAARGQGRCGARAFDRRACGRELRADERGDCTAQQRARRLRR